MIGMLRSVVLAAFLFALPPGTPLQPLSVLQIKVTVSGADGRIIPVSRHALLVSDNPSSAPPRRVVTGLDGTASVSLRPGNYTIESDRAVTIAGRTYEWTVTLDLPEGRGATLELTAANATVASDSAEANRVGPGGADASSLLTEWQDSVVAIWTPTAHASGVLLDAGGLIATNARVIGVAKSVEVQVTPQFKVAGVVLASDTARDVAVLRINPQAVASIKPVPLGCGASGLPPPDQGQGLFTIVTPLRDRKGMISGAVERIDGQSIVADFGLPSGSSGGPVFSAAGTMLGITAPIQNDGDRSRGDSRLIRVEHVCTLVVEAGNTMKGTPPPPATSLPLEPTRPFPVEALKDAAQHRAGSLLPYQMSSSQFDIAFITPVQIYGAEYQLKQASERERAGGTRRSGTDTPFVRPLLEFSNWFEYVRDDPPVLLVRATPKLVEGFWMKVARGAAQTQGVSLPPIRRFTSGFARLRAFCGDAEVTPIHPFRLEQRIGDDDAIYEGLYVFDPSALGPACGTVRLALYSEKEPEKADTRTVDPVVVRQIWDDFAPYRAAK
jgi:S1-C subfamily serine protease